MGCSAGQSCFSPASACSIRGFSPVFVSYAGTGRAGAGVGGAGELDEAAGVLLEGVGGLGEVEPLAQDWVLLQRGEFREEAGLVLVEGADQDAAAQGSPCVVRKSWCFPRSMIDRPPNQDLGKKVGFQLHQLRQPLQWMLAPARGWMSAMRCSFAGRNLAAPGES